MLCESGTTDEPTPVTVATAPVEEVTDEGVPSVRFNTASSDVPQLMPVQYKCTDTWGHPIQTKAVGGGAFTCPNVPFSLLEDGNTFTVGSSEECDVTVPLAEIAAEHATFSMKGGELFVTDNGSENGTTVTRKNSQPPRSVSIGKGLPAGEPYQKMIVTKCSPNEPIAVLPGSTVQCGSKFVQFEYRKPSVSELIKIGCPPASMEIVTSRYTAPYDSKRRLSSKPQTFFVTSRDASGKTVKTFLFDATDGEEVSNKKTIGRAADCDIVVDSEFISEVQAVFEVRGGSCFVTDCASANGTKATTGSTGKSAALLPGVPMRLINGDMVTLGQSTSATFTLVQEDSAKLQFVSSDIAFKPWSKKPPKDDDVVSGKGKDYKAPEFAFLREGESVTVGSDEGCDIVIPLVYISSKHAKVSKVNGQITVTDLGSTNGTEVLESVGAVSDLKCEANVPKSVPSNGYVRFGEFAVYKVE